VNTVSDRLLTFREVALRIGVSVREIYRLIHRGELPGAVKIGRAARIPESEVVAYIENLKGRRGPSCAA
jgi:excisionase family DNA binding protein